MSFDEQPATRFRQTLGPAARRREPTVSIVVTNHNYGHFLDDCLASVFAQVRPADQVIVVDDGSTDGSRAVLAPHAGRVEAVWQENAGQAAAFNRGFALASGDIVLFLDADDRLRPEALEAVLAHWHPGLALLAFGLELIDAAGRSVGVHPFSLRADAGDNRPRLLRSGSIAGPFAFAPTSGNAFARGFLERVLPMDETGWRICADAYLVRAAALAGRFGAVRRVLGSYRAHGGNNYFRPDTFDAWSMRRGLRDLDTAARALETLAAEPRLPADAGEEAALRTALWLRAMETRGNLATWTRDFRAFALQVRRAVGGLLRADLPARERLAAVAATTRFALGVRLTRGTADPSLGDGAPPARPARNLPGAAALERRLAALERPRWPEPVPCTARFSFDCRGPHHELLAEGWAGASRDGLCWSTGPAASLRFELEPGHGPVEVEVGLGLPEGSPPGRFALWSGDSRVWTGDVAERGTACFTLDRDEMALRQAVALMIRCRLRQRLRERLRLGPARFRLLHLALGERAPAPVHPYVAGPTPAGAGWLLAAARPEDGWEIEPAGAALRAGRDGVLGLSFVPRQCRAEVEVRTATACGVGWLRVRIETEDLFTGEVGPDRTLRLPLPDLPPRAAVHAALTFAFEPAEPDGSPCVLQSVRLREPCGSKAEPALRHLCGSSLPSLAPGQIVYLAGSSALRGLLGAGWLAGPEGEARTAATEAALAFALAPGTIRPVLRLGVRPVLPRAAGTRHVVGISIRGVLVRTVELVGPAELELPLDTECPEIRLTVHSMLLRQGEPATGAPRHAALDLVWVALGGEEEPRPAPELPVPPETPFSALVAAAGEQDPAGQSDEFDRLLELRTALARAIAVADDRALAMIAAQPGALDRLVAIGAAAAGAPDDEAEAFAGRAAGLGRDGDPAGLLRGVMLSMLLLPAFRSGAAADFTRLPALILDQPEALAAWLGREPRVEDDAEARDYLAWLEALCLAIHGVLAAERPGGGLRALAERILTDLRSTSALFCRGDLSAALAARSAAVERLLVQSGARLAALPTPRANATALRVGFFVRTLRPSPETWSVLGTLRGLDRTRLRPVLITLDRTEEDLAAEDVSPDRLSLEALSVEEAVEAIRGLELDVFVLCAHVANWETVTSLVAHRLARLQVVSGFNCPSTLGLRSFGHVLAWKGAAGPAGGRDYTEALVETAEPLQCCFDFRGVPEVAGDRDGLRRELGLPTDAVLLVSGAMAHKIGPELMRAWAAVLAAVPESRLVLYPFARVWSMCFAPAAFRRRLDRCLAERGVAPERAVVLPEQSAGEVRRILRSSDVYLDSFPYSGATTVCEALLARLPVVAIEGERPRERTGAAWLAAYGLPDLVARSAEDYVATAAGLAGDGACRAALAARLAAREGPEPASDFTRFGRAFSDALWDIAARSGLFPGLGAAAPEVVREPAPSAWRRPGARAPRPPEPETGPPVRTAVLAVARTGSTWLCDMIGRSRDTLMDHELFHGTEIQLRGGVVREAGAIARRDADPVGWLERHLGAAADAGYRLIGFKLFAHHPEAVLRHVAREGFRLLVLTRENVFAQYASFRIAEATQQWVLRPGEAARQVRLDFDPGDFERFEGVMRRLRERLDATAGAAAGPVLRLDYLGLSRPETRARLSDFLGREIPGPGGSEPSKQNPGPVVERFADPDAARAYLASRGREDWAELG